MISLVLILVLLACAAVAWLQGLWDCAVKLINVLLAGLLAFNYYEWLAVQLANNLGSYTYLLDFLSFWGIFALSFVVLRVVSDMLSRHRVTFNIWVEMVGRTVLALWIGWLFAGLVEVSLHMAPLPAHPLGFQRNVDDGNLLGFSPGRQWLGLIQSRSRGALSRADGSANSPFPADEGKRVFDPTSQYIIKYYQRRVDFESEPDYRVN